MNLDIDTDPFMIQRGLIAGAVAISISPHDYYSWSALINGFCGGLFFVLSSRINHIFGYDDPLLIGTTHGMSSVYSLLTICLFHKEEGFFFKDISNFVEDEHSKARGKIIVILGSNILGFLAVLILITLIGLLVFWTCPMDLRISKYFEIIGQDCQMHTRILKDIRV